MDEFLYSKHKQTELRDMKIERMWKVEVVSGGRASYTWEGAVYPLC